MAGKLLAWSVEYVDQVDYADQSDASKEHKRMLRIPSRMRFLGAEANPRAVRA
jgi:hypothetical protein